VGAVAWIVGFLTLLETLQKLMSVTAAVSSEMFSTHCSKKKIRKAENIEERLVIQPVGKQPTHEGRGFYNERT